MYFKSGFRKFIYKRGIEKIKNPKNKSISLVRMTLLNRIFVINFLNIENIDKSFFSVKRFKLDL